MAPLPPAPPPAEVEPLLPTAAADVTVDGDLRPSRHVLDGGGRQSSVGLAMGSRRLNLSAAARRRLSLAFVLLDTSLCLSAACALEPLLPPLARIKGLSNSASGVFFGATVLLSAAAGAVSRPFLDRAGLVFSVVAGSAAAGVCAALTGLLQFSPPGTTFSVLLFVTGAVGALGSGLAIAAAYSALPVLYPRDMGFAGGCMLLATTAAFALSPAAAGALSGVAGFAVPMALFGALLLLSALGSAGAVEASLAEEESALTAVKAAGAVLAAPPVLVALFTVLIASVATGFTSPTLEPFLSSAFSLSPAEIGLLFLVSAAGGFISPFVGVLCDRRPLAPKLLQAPSLLAVGASVLLWNPSPLLRLGEPRLGLTAGALAAFGVAMSVLVTAAISDLFVEAERACGPGEVFATVTAILYNLVYSLGLFLGSVLGGTALDSIGYADATTLLGLAVAGLAVPNLAVHGLRLWQVRRHTLIRRVPMEGEGEGG